MKGMAAELGRIRREAGITQEALAERLGVTQGYVTKLETGKRRVTFEAASDWASACGFRLRVILVPEEGEEDPLIARAAALLPYAPPDLRRSIAGLLEAVAQEHLRRAVR